MAFTDSARQLLITLELVTKGIDQLQAANTQINEVMAGRASTISQNIDFTTTGLPAARKAFQDMGMMGPEAERAFDAASASLSKYSGVIEDARKKIGFLSQQREALLGFKAVAKGGFNREFNEGEIDAMLRGQSALEQLRHMNLIDFDDLDLSTQKRALRTIDDGLNKITEGNRLAAKTARDAGGALRAEFDESARVLNNMATPKAPVPGAAGVAPTGAVPVGGVGVSAEHIAAANNAMIQFVGTIERMVLAMNSMIAAQGNVEQSMLRMAKTMESAMDRAARAAMTMSARASRAATIAARQSVMPAVPFAAGPLTSPNVTLIATQAAQQAVALAAANAAAAAIPASSPNISLMVNQAVQSAMQKQALAAAAAPPVVPPVVPPKAPPAPPPPPKPPLSFFGATAQGIQHKNAGLISSMGFATARLGRYALAATLLYSTARAFRAAAAAGIEYEDTLRDIQGILASRSFGEATVIGRESIEAAVKYGYSLTEAAQAAKTFAQTGASAMTVVRQLNAALIGARGAGLELEQAKELIIAIERITDGEIQAMEILDRISRVEARRAVTAQDLAVTLQRVGPVVHQLKGDLEGLTDEFDIAMGVTTAIIERTRVTGTQAATSVRFILSRLGSPQILRQAQQLSGVGFARPGGKELRPFNEILEELSIAYKKMVEAKDTGRATQLLTTLGGARQIQSTAVLLGDFSSVLDVARQSSLAFSDAEERVALRLNTVRAAAGQLSSAWGRLGAVLATDPILNQTAKGGLHLGQGLLNFLSEGLEAFSRFERHLGGKSAFAPKFLDLSLVSPEQLQRMSAFTASAQKMGLTTDELLGIIRQTTTEMDKGLAGEFTLPAKHPGGNLGAVLDLVRNTKTDEFRSFHENVGTKMAEALGKAIPGFAAFTEGADASRTAIQLLSEAAFMEGAVISFNTERLKDTFEGIQNSLGQTLMSSLAKTKVRTGGGGWNLQPQIDLSQQNMTVRTMSDMRTAREAITNARHSIIQDLENVDVPLAHITERLFTNVEGTEAWERALSKVVAVGEVLDRGALGKTLDVFAQDLFSPEKAAATIARLKEGIQKGIIEGGLPGSESLSSILPSGQAGVNLILGGVRTAAEQMLSDANKPLDDAARQRVIDFAQGIQLAQANKAGYLASLEKGFAKVQSRLLDLISQFVIAVDSANQLDTIYGRLGITFDLTSQKFDAANSLLIGLTKIQNEVRAEVVKSMKTQLALSGALTEAQGDEGDEATANALELAAQFANVGLPPDMISALTSKGSQNALENEKERVAQLRAELAGLKGTLVDVFGSSAEGVAMLQLFRGIMGEFGLSDKQVLAAFASLKLGVEGYLAGLQKELDIRKLVTAELEYQLNLAELYNEVAVQKLDQSLQNQLYNERSRSELARELLTLADKKSAAVQEEVRSIKTIAQLEASTARDKTQAERQMAETKYINKVMELAAAKDMEGTQLAAAQLEAYRTFDAARQKIDADAAAEQAKLLVESGQKVQDALRANVLSTFQEMQGQIQSNIQSATAGFVSVLTDFEAFRHGAAKNILAPIGDTFMKRTAENMMSELFTASGEGFFNRIARQFAETPEQKLRMQLQMALSTGGDDIAMKFRMAGNDFNAQLAAILGSSFSPSAMYDKSGLSLVQKGARANEKKTNSALSQMALLLGTQVGGLAGGGGSGAQIGAQLAGSIGAMITNPYLGALMAIGGGLLGGLFDKDDKQKAVQSLRKIEEYTARSADVLELERRYMEITRGAVNVPASFTIPKFSPSAAGQSIMTQTNTVHVNVEVNNPTDGKAVLEVVRRELGPVLTDELRKIGL